MIKSDVSGLGKWSKQLIGLICDDCGIEKSMSYKLYTSYGYENGEYYCRKCKLKRNNLERWGVENVFQLKEVKEKIKKTNLEKFGVENPSQNPEINKRVKESMSKLDKEEVNKKRESTNLEKWGVKNVSQVKEIKEKKSETNIENWGKFYLKTGEFRNYIKNNNLEKWGNEIYFKTEDFLNKSKKTNLEKWGVENPSQNKEVINRIKKSLKRSLNDKTLNKFENIININNDTFEIYCNECKSNFTISKILFYKRRETKTTICTDCNKVDKHQSGKEIKLFNFISSIYNGEIIQSYRDVYEIDIYLPDLKIGFEFNGVYWHSDLYKEKNSHLEKTKYFKERGIRIIHIWEDDWDFKTDIIKSQITNWLGLSKKIFARKCNIKEVDVSEAISFLEENHIQGKIGSNLKIGLYYEDKLVSLMTFDNLEGRKRMSDGNWNINRYCNKRGYSIVGGASKIFKYFLENYEVDRVISYADRDWSLGGLYDNLGFKKVGENNPDYKYVVNGIRVHKSGFKKSKTGISESKLNIPKIWDCGKIKYEYLK